jgi:hypothetical protein
VQTGQQSPRYPTPTYAPTQSYTPAEPPVPSEEAPRQPATPSNTIDSVYVTAESGNGLILKKGDVFELQPSTPSNINPPYMTFRWSSQGAGGEVSSSDCNVSADISGPGDYPQHRRSGDCSGRVSPDLRIISKTAPHGFRCFHPRGSRRQAHRLMRVQLRA